MTNRPARVPIHMTEGRMTEGRMTESRMTESRMTESPARPSRPRGPTPGGSGLPRLSAAAPPTARDPRDGRLLRSERSREAIIAALLELVGEGVLAPTADQVAERAGVGIRTVFRHFSDTEGLLASIDARMQAQVLPLLTAGSPEGTRAQRAGDMVSHRAAFFERVRPYKRAEVLRRWRSDFLSGQHAALVRRLRSELQRWLPEIASAPPDLADALELACSFEAWDRLRSEQRLSRPRAQAAMQRAVAALVRELPGLSRPVGRTTSR